VTATAGEVTYRAATLHDAEGIAHLHADSWRRNYRGAFSDAYLDGDLVAERLSVWTERLRSPRPGTFTIVAEHLGPDPGPNTGPDTGRGPGAIVGLAHTILGDDPAWGALLDNLHVSHAEKGHGIGTRLMAETARGLIARDPASSLFLWVLAQNTAAQAFYDARGGTCVDRQSRSPEPGDRLRYTWPDPSRLLLDQAEERAEERADRQ
jgi:ribosomal protein S18 acetylase RimI-like enzyme